MRNSLLRWEILSFNAPSALFFFLQPLSSLIRPRKKNSILFRWFFVRFLDALVLAVQVFIVRRRWRASTRWNKGVTAERAGRAGGTTATRLLFGRGLKFSVELQWVVEEAARLPFSADATFDEARSLVPCHVVRFMHERASISPDGNRPFSSPPRFSTPYFSVSQPDRAYPLLAELLLSAEFLSITRGCSFVIKIAFSTHL